MTVRKISQDLAKEHFWNLEVRCDWFKYSADARVGGTRDESLRESEGEATKWDDLIQDFSLMGLKRRTSYEVLTTRFSKLTEFFPVVNQFTR